MGPRGRQTKSCSPSASAVLSVSPSVSPIQEAECAGPLKRHRFQVFFHLLIISDVTSHPSSHRDSRRSPTPHPSQNTTTTSYPPLPHPSPNHPHTSHHTSRHTQYHQNVKTVSRPPAPPGRPQALPSAAAPTGILRLIYPYKKKSKSHNTKKTHTRTQPMP